MPLEGCVKHLAPDDPRRERYSKAIESLHNVAAAVNAQSHDLEGGEQMVSPELSFPLSLRR